jgi:signal transduction histidine kinase
MQSNKQQSDIGLNFIEALAQRVHDIKNSVGVILSNADAIVQSDAGSAIKPQITSMQTEARRINHGLIHLLGLYKLDQSTYGISRDIVDCEELILELQAYNDALLTARGLEFELSAEEAVEGYFDRELVVGILNSAINNAQRYAHGIVRVGVSIEDGYTVLSVEDDGDGFPEDVLNSLSDAGVGATNYCTGNTGLGLFFARRIAELHQHRGRIGRVGLSNDGINGGASFRLWLP